jgi:hypothetical protein
VALNFDAFSGKAPRSVYARFFRAPIHFAQAHAGLHIGRSPLEVHLQSVNESLRQIAVDYLSRLEAPGQNLTSWVRQALRHTLGSTGGKKTDIADLLGMHPRTLQRHLKAEGPTRGRPSSGSTRDWRLRLQILALSFGCWGGGDIFRRELVYRDDIDAA